MRRRATFLALLALAACASTRVVDRAADGTPILIGGAQPDAESLQKLQKLYGIQTVVNLRGEFPYEAWFVREGEAVTALGLRWIQLPTSGYLAPPEETVNAFFDIVEADANWPIFVHCQMGIHRTGLMLALYRMQYQGWTGDQAWTEMVANGFHWTRVDRSAVEAYVRSFAPDPTRTIQR
jgi:tyrosine-protein phosphatase SIW14